MQNNGEETGWVSSRGGPCRGPTPATAQTATPTPQRGARLPRKHPEGHAPGREGGCCRALALQGHPTRYVPAALAHVWLSPLRVVIALRGRGSHRDEVVASATLWHPHSQLVQVARGSSCWMMGLSAASSWPALAKQLFCPSLNVLVPQCPRCQRDTAGRVAHVHCGATSHSLPEPPVAAAVTGSPGTCFLGQAPSQAEGTTCPWAQRSHGGTRRSCGTEERMGVPPGCEPAAALVCPQSFFIPASLRLWPHLLGSVPNRNAVPMCCWSFFLSAPS